MTDEPEVTESASEKRRPGRPSKWMVRQPDAESMGKGYRAAVHGVIAGTAIARLQGVLGVQAGGVDASLPAPFDYLVSPRWRYGLLTELGRIEDDEAMLAAARVVCEARMPAKVACARVRRFRLGRLDTDAESDSERLHALGRELHALIDQHRRAYDLTHSDVVAVLRGLLDEASA